MKVYTRPIKEAEEKYFYNRKERDVLAKKLRGQGFVVEVGKFYISELRPNGETFWVRAWKETR